MGRFDVFDDEGRRLEQLLALDEPAHCTACGETPCHPCCPTQLWVREFDAGDARVPDVDALLDAELGKVSA